MNRLRSMAAAAMAVLCLAAPSLANAKWLKVESDRFIVYGSSEREARNYAQKLEDFENLLRIYHGMPAEEATPRKFEIVLVSSLGQLRRVSASATETTGGVYISSPRRVFAVARHELGDSDFILFHEYTHHFMYQHFSYGYPAWMVEGYAEYFAPTVITDTTIDVGYYNQSRVVDLYNTRQLKLDVLLSKTPSSFKPGDRFAFYSQAWRLTHYMLSDPERRKQVNAYLHAVGDGADPVDAMAKATGMDLETLGRKLKAYDKLPYTHMKRNPQPDAAVRVTQLSRAADDLLLESFRPLENVPEADRPAFLERVRAAAAKHPDDRFAQLTLARTEIEFGMPLEAEAIIKVLLAADPKDAEALLLMGLCKLKEGDEVEARREELYKEARPYFVRAYKEDPTSFETLFAYARSRTVDGDYPNENTLKTLLEAHGLAPQVTEISLATADALIRARRHEDAALVLTPMANDPHRTESAGEAKRLLARIKPAAPAAKAAAEGEATAAPPAG